MANTLSSFNQQFQRQSKLSHSANRQSPQISCAIKKSFNSITKVFDCSKLCSNEKPLSIIKQYFPIFEWISKYKRDDLVPDFISGLTIAVFHIPECKFCLWLVENMLISFGVRHGLQFSSRRQSDLLSLHIPVPDVDLRHYGHIVVLFDRFVVVI